MPFLSSLVQCAERGQLHNSWWISVDRQQVATHFQLQIVRIQHVPHLHRAKGKETVAARQLHVARRLLCTQIDQVVSAVQQATRMWVPLSAATAGEMGANSAATAAGIWRTLQHCGRGWRRGSAKWRGRGRSKCGGCLFNNECSGRSY